MDSIMRANGTGKEIGDLASEIHHDNYMAAMDRRVAALGPDARAVLDRRMAAERERIMAGHPDLSIAEARARAAPTSSPNPAWRPYRPRGSATPSPAWRPASTATPTT